MMLSRNVSSSHLHFPSIFQDILRRKEAVDKLHLIPASRIIKQLDKLSSPSLALSDEDRLLVTETAFKISDLMRKNRLFSESLALLNWVTEACEVFSDVKNKIAVMKRCGRAVWSVAISMKRKKENFTKEISKEAIPILKILLDKMESTGTKDIREIAETQAWCFYYAAACFQYVRKYSNVYAYSSNAIALMQDIFGDDYKKHRVVGLSHAIAGEAWSCMKNYNYALEDYQKATEVFAKAEDINSDMYRKSCINREKSKIAILRQEILFASLPKKRGQLFRKSTKKEPATTSNSNSERSAADGHLELLSLTINED